MPKSFVCLLLTERLYTFNVKKIISFITFGIAFGLLEAIVVFYLHKIVGLHISYLPLKDVHVILDLKAVAFITTQDPILKSTEINSIEIIRELSTIIMLLSVGYLSGETIKQRTGAFLMTFGLWDIFYYIFLRLLIGWPKSIFDADVFFLIPVPWIGPIITPLVISFLFILIGVKLFTHKIKQ